MELKEFIKKYQIAVCQDGKDRKIRIVFTDLVLRADSSIARCPSDIEYLKSHKAEIIQYLDSERDRVIAEEEAKNRAKYAKLIAQLPERKNENIFKIILMPKSQSFVIHKSQKTFCLDIENTPDEEKFREIISRISHHHFTGEEEDGLNLALRASNNEIYREAGKYCNHDLKTEYQYTYTQDGRKKLIRTISCAKCQLYIRDIVEEHREYNGN